MKKRYRKYKKKWLVLVWIIVVLCILGLYLWTTNLIETNLYPTEHESFILRIISNMNDTCMSINPSEITYYNDVSKNAQTETTGNEYFNPNTPNMLYMNIWVGWGILCKFENAEIIIKATNLMFPIKSNVSSNLSSVTKISADSFSINLNYDENSLDQEIRLWIPINREFFNYYDFQGVDNTRGVNNANMGGIRRLDFRFKDDISGYYTDETSFTLLEGKQRFQERNEEPVFAGKSKRYYIDNSYRVFLRFTPKSKVFFLLQKILDALILGIMSAMLYDLFFQKQIFLWLSKAIYKIFLNRR